jgi:tetratricopeptide (TPR) repeat protein
MVFLGLGVALFPLAVHQTRTLGSPQLLTLNGGLNLYIGNNAMSKGVYNLPSELDLESDFTARRAASRLAGTDLTLAQSSQFWSKRALDYLTDHPGDWFRLSVRKAMLFFSPREIPQIEDFQILRERHLFLKLALIDFRWILPLALLGCLARLRWPWGRLKATAPQGVAGVVLGPWLILIAVGWLSTMVFFATGRYRIPFLAGFLGLAAAGFLDLMDGVRAHRFRPHLVVLPLAVMFQLLLPGYSAAKACAYDHEQAGLRFVRAGNASASLEEYRQATQIDPDDGLAWHGMGVALVRLNRLPEAAESYRQAARRLSQSASTHYNLGIVYARMGQDSGALVELQEAVRLDPFDVRIRSDMAVALARLGREADAEQAVRQVLGQNPSYAPALRLLRELGQSR